MLKKMLLVLYCIGLLIFPKEILAEDISVTATVGTTVNDLDMSITASKSEGTILAEGQEVTFTIQYRSTVSSGSYPLTLEANWNQGLIDGTSNYIDVYNYVIGSATTADDGTVPTVNLTTNTITWSISSLGSSSSSHEVSFKLKVRTDLPTENVATVYTDLNATYSTVTIPEERYLLKAQIATTAPTSTPTPTTVHPSATAAPGPSATSTPATPTPTIITAKKTLLEFESVLIKEITNESLSFDTTTNAPTYITVFYGSCNEQLSKKIVGDTLSKNHTVEIKGLQSDSFYCFQLYAQDALKRDSISSDKFIFQTAKTSDVHRVEETLFTWNNVLLGLGDKEKLVIPTETTLVLNFRVDNPEQIEQIVARFENTSVLGLTTISSAHVEQTPLIEISKGVFSGEILSPKKKVSTIWC